jgi:hypothetical protein
MNFNEWLTQNHGDESSDLKVIDQDDALVVNQLEQFVDRIAGILHTVSEDKKTGFVEKLISDLRERLQ